MKRSFRDYIALFLAALAAFLAATGALSTRRVEGLNHAAERMDHIQLVIANLKDTLSALDLAESSQRGYVLVGKQPYLQPYDAALRKSQTYIGDLLTMTQDDDKEQHNLKLLQSLIQQKINFLKAGILTRQKSGLEAAAKLAALEADLKVTNRIHATVSLMERRQSELLQDVRSESNTTSERTGRVVSLLSIFNFALVFVIYYLVNQDYYQRRRHETELHRLATTDELTSLHNRRGFITRLEEEISRAKRHRRSISLLLMDVDSFKAYNDSYGHQAGDQVLMQLAAIIQQTGRSTDFAARYGGEELVLLVPESQQEDSVLIAERIRSRVDSARWPNRPITVSIGVATLSPNQSESVDSIAQKIIGDADRALYFAKSTGRNRVVHVNDVGEWRNAV
jgi:diguanylate cyclase (GGDEF)-like protein